MSAPSLGRLMADIINATAAKITVRHLIVPVRLPVNDNAKATP